MKAILFYGTVFLLALVVMYTADKVGYERGYARGRAEQRAEDAKQKFTACTELGTHTVCLEVEPDKKPQARVLGTPEQAKGSAELPQQGIVLNAGPNTICRVDSDNSTSNITCRYLPPKPHKKPAKEGWLVQDENGAWKTLSKEEMCKRDWANISRESLGCAEKPAKGQDWVHYYKRGYEAALIDCQQKPAKGPAPEIGGEHLYCNESDITNCTVGPAEVQR